MGPKKGRQVKSKKKEEEENEDNQVEADSEDGIENKNSRKKQKTTTAAPVSSIATGRSKRAAATVNRKKIEEDSEDENEVSQDEDMEVESDDEKPKKRGSATNKSKPPPPPPKSSKKKAAANKNKKKEESEEESEDDDDESTKVVKKPPTPTKKKPAPSKSKKAAASAKQTTPTKKRKADESEEESESESDSEEEEIEMEFKKPSKPATPTKKKQAASASQSQQGKKSTQSQSSQTNTPRSKILSFEPSKQKKVFNLKKLNIDRLKDEDYIKPEVVVQTKLIKRLTKLEHYLTNVTQVEFEGMSDTVLKMLMTESLLKSKNNEVRLLVACCLVELFRLSWPNVPIEEEEPLKDIYEVFVYHLFSFDEIIKDGEHLFPQYYHLIERLASLKVFSVLVKLDSQGLHEFLRSTLQLIDETLPPSLAPLMRAIVSSVIQNLEDYNVKIMDALTESMLDSERGTLTMRAEETQVIFNDNKVYLEDLYLTYIREMVGGSSQSTLRGRKNEIIYHLFKHHPTFLDQSGVYDLAIDLHNPDAKVRKSAVLMVSQLFTSDPHLDEEYSELFVKFLKRTMDTEKRIRMIMLEFANMYPVDSTYSDIILDYLILRLKDTEPEIRAKTIPPVCEYIIKRTKLLTPKMLKNFYDRVRDKDSNVRKTAVVTLSKVWKALREKNGPIEDWPEHLSECFDCIPNVLFSSLSLHDDDRFRLEVAVDTILLECYNSPKERSEKFLEIYGYLDAKSKDALFNYLERKRAVLKEFDLLVEVFEEHPDDKKLIEKHITYVDNFIPRYANEHTKTLLKQLLQPSNKKTLALLKDISNHNTTPQDQYKIKVAILEKASKSDGAFSEFMKYFAFLLNYTFISKFTLEFILDGVINDLPDGGNTFDEKKYYKEKKKEASSVENSIEILLRVSKISPILFEEYSEKLISLCLQSRAITDNVIEVIHNVVDHFPKLSKANLKKLQSITLNLMQIGTPKIVKMAYRILVKVTPNKEELNNLLTDLADNIGACLDNKPRNVIASLVALGLIARNHHALIDNEMYELIEIFVYKGIMAGKSKADVNMKQWKHLDVQYSKEVFLKIYGIYYLGNYLRGLPPKSVTRKAYELATYLYDFLYLPERTANLKPMEAYHIKLAVNIEAMRMLQTYHFSLCFLPVHFIGFCRVALIKTEVRHTDTLQHRFFHKLDKSVRLNRIPLRFMAAFGLTAQQPHSLVNMVKKQVSSIIKMKRMTIARIDPSLKLEGECYPEDSFYYFIYLISHMPGVEEQYPDFKDVTVYFKHYINMMIEEKDNYSVLMNYLFYIRGSMDALDPYSKNTRRVANHGILILTEEYKDRKWKVQKFQSQTNLPKEYYIYQPNVDFKEYDRDTSDKLPDFFVVMNGKGSERLNESTYYKNQLEKTPTKALPSNISSQAPPKSTPSGKDKILEEEREKDKDKVDEEEDVENEEEAVEKDNEEEEVEKDNEEEEVEKDNEEEVEKDNEEEMKDVSDDEDI